MRDMSLHNVGTAVIAFYLLVACNFLPQVLGCRLQELLYNNIWAKHAVGILTLNFLVVATSPDAGGLLTNMGKTILIYTWFVLTTRLPEKLMLFNIFLLFCLYISFNSTNRLGSSPESAAAPPPSPDDDARMKALMHILVLSSIVCTFFGSLLYLSEKMREYEADFSIRRFITGSVKCRGFTPSFAKV